MTSCRFDDQFVVDVYQAGIGISFHLNANEVIAKFPCHARPFDAGLTLMRLAPLMLTGELLEALLERVRDYCMRQRSAVYKIPSRGRQRSLSVTIP